MSSESNPTTQPVIASTAHTLARHQGYRAQQFFQFALFLLVASSLWMMLGPEPTTKLDFCIEILVLALGFFSSMLAWLACSQYKLVYKLSLVLFSLVVIILIASSAIIRFDLGNRVLEPAVIIGSRVIHHSLELSYRVPPQAKVNLAPTMTKQTVTANNRFTRTGNGLHFGETAVISRMTSARASDETNTPRWTIVLEIQRARVSDLNAFIMNVRNNESGWAKFPNIQITTPTRLQNRRGVDMVEFTFAERPSKLFSRQVYIQQGPFILNFMLNSEVESDNHVFDEFLDSIELNSTFPWIGKAIQ